MQFKTTLNKVQCQIGENTLHQLNIRRIITDMEKVENRVLDKCEIKQIQLPYDNV